MLTSDEAKILERKGVKIGERVNHVFRSGRKEGFFVKSGSGHALCPIKEDAERLMKENDRPSQRRDLASIHGRLPVIRPHLDHKPRIWKGVAA